MVTFRKHYNKQDEIWRIVTKLYKLSTDYRTCKSSDNQTSIYVLVYLDNLYFRDGAKPSAQMLG
jgi:hypothetical protein